MEKNKKDAIKEDKVQTDKSIKNNDLPEENPMTDVSKNIASETPGLNQTKTTRDDLFPSD